MTPEENYKLLVGAYYGVTEMDEYSLKVYILKQIEDTIKDFISRNPSLKLDFYQIAKSIEDELPLKTKLQDSLIILNKIHAPLELILLVKNKLEELKNAK